MVGEHAANLAEIPRGLPQLAPWHLQMLWTDLKQLALESKLVILRATAEILSLERHYRLLGLHSRLRWPLARRVSYAQAPAHGHAREHLPSE